MTDAYVHVIAEPSAINQAATAIAALDAVATAHLVTGEHDITVQVDVPEDRTVADVVLNDIQSVMGVLDTETHVAFEP